ncbi:MAG: hypothetical protein U0610_03870 [bacterium]
MFEPHDPCPYNVREADGRTWCRLLGRVVTDGVSDHLPCDQPALDWSVCPAYRWARGASTSPHPKPPQLARKHDV